MHLSRHIFLLLLSISVCSSDILSSLFSIDIPLPLQLFIYLLRLFKTSSNPFFLPQKTSCPLVCNFPKIFPFFLSPPLLPLFLPPSASQVVLPLLPPTLNLKLPLCPTPSRKLFPLRPPPLPPSLSLSASICFPKLSVICYSSESVGSQKGVHTLLWTLFFSSSPWGNRSISEELNFPFIAQCERERERKRGWSSLRLCKKKKKTSVVFDAVKTTSFV